MTQWPLQSECDTFYGNPRHGKPWRKANLVSIRAPWNMFDDDTHEPVGSFLIHFKVAVSLSEIFTEVWDLYSQSQEAIQNAHLDLFAGSYVFRDIRGASHLSMHAYGCALDIAGNENPLGRRWHAGMMPLQVVDIFEKQGWVWGGRWHRPDAMHFQAARIG